MASKRDIAAVAAAIFGEAVNESKLGREAVAHTIVNRAEISGRSLSDVVYGSGSSKYGQFSFANPGAQANRVAAAPRTNPDLWQRSVAEAEAVIDGREAGTLEDPTHGATHYHANYVTPSWKKSYPQTAKIGTHVFYKAPNAQVKHLVNAAADSGHRRDDLIPETAIAAIGTMQDPAVEIAALDAVPLPVSAPRGDPFASLIKPDPLAVTALTPPGALAFANVAPRGARMSQLVPAPLESVQRAMLAGTPGALPPAPVAPVQTASLGMLPDALPPAPAGTVERGAALPAPLTPAPTVPVERGNLPNIPDPLAPAPAGNVRQGAPLLPPSGGKPSLSGPDFGSTRILSPELNGPVQGGLDYPPYESISPEPMGTPGPMATRLPPAPVAPVERQALPNVADPLAAAITQAVERGAPLPPALTRTPPSVDRSGVTSDNLAEALATVDSADPLASLLGPQNGRPNNRPAAPPAPTMNTSPTLPSTMTMPDFASTRILSPQPMGDPLAATLTRRSIIGPDVPMPRPSPATPIKATGTGAMTQAQPAVASAAASAVVPPQSAPAPISQPSGLRVSKTESMTPEEYAAYEAAQVAAMKPEDWANMPSLPSYAGPVKPLAPPQQVNPAPSVQSVGSPISGNGQPGEKRKGNDGKTYQYVQISDDGSKWGWTELNENPPGGADGSVFTAAGHEFWNGATDRATFTDGSTAWRDQDGQMYRNVPKYDRVDIWNPTTQSWVPSGMGLQDVLGAMSGGMVGNKPGAPQTKTLEKGGPLANVNPFGVKNGKVGLGDIILAGLGIAGGAFVGGPKGAAVGGQLAKGLTDFGAPKIDKNTFPPAPDPLSKLFPPAPAAPAQPAGSAITASGGISNAPQAKLGDKIVEDAKAAAEKAKTEAAKQQDASKGTAPASVKSSDSGAITDSSGRPLTYEQQAQLSPTLAEAIFSGKAGLW